MSLLCQGIPQDLFGCYLFSYRGNVVAIDIVGAGIPLALSLFFLIRLGIHSGGRISPRRIGFGASLVVVLAAATAAEYTIWDALFGGISINTGVLLYTVILPIGFLHFWLLDRKSGSRPPISPAYIVGALGLTLSDLLRTFTGALNVSPLIMGGGGPWDAIFLGPLLVVIGYLFADALHVVINRRRARLAARFTIEAPKTHSENHEAYDVVSDLIRWPDKTQSLLGFNRLDYSGLHNTDTGNICGREIEVVCDRSHVVATRL